MATPGPGGLGRRTQGAELSGDGRAIYESAPTPQNRVLFSNPSSNKRERMTIRVGAI